MINVSLLKRLERTVLFAQCRIDLRNVLVINIALLRTASICPRMLRARFVSPMEPRYWKSAPSNASGSSSGRYWPGDGDTQIGDQSAGERVDPAMHRHGLAARPGLLDEDVRGDVPNLADDVELAKPVQALPIIDIGGELVSVIVGDFADRM